MDYLNAYHSIAALFIARVFLGLLFLFQGYDAVVRIRVRNVARAIEGPLASKGVPRFLVLWGSFFTSYGQLAGGILLVCGLFRYITLYVLGLDLLIASIGFGLASPLWDTKHVFPRIALLVFLLLMPASSDLFSLDFLLFNN